MSSQGRFVKFFVKWSLHDPSRTTFLGVLVYSQHTVSRSQAAIVLVSPRRTRRRSCSPSMLLLGLKNRTSEVGFFNRFALLRVLCVSGAHLKHARGGTRRDVCAELSRPTLTTSLRLKAVGTRDPSIDATGFI